MVINIEKEYQVIFSIDQEEYKMFKKPDILYRLNMLIRKSKPNHIKPFMGFKAKLFLEYKNKIIGEAKSLRPLCSDSHSKGRRNRPYGPACRGTETAGHAFSPASPSSQCAS